MPLEQQLKPFTKRAPVKPSSLQAGNTKPDEMAGHACVCRIAFVAFEPWHPVSTVGSAWKLLDGFRGFRIAQIKLESLGVRRHDFSREPYVRILCPELVFSQTKCSG